MIRIVLGEAVIIGLVGSVLGIVLGLLIAAGAKAAIGSFLNTDLGSGLPLQPTTIVLSVLVGVGVTVISAVLPARRASRVAPVAAMRGDVGAVAGGLGKRGLVGAALLVAGAMVLGAAVTRDQVSWPVAALGAVAAVLGMLIAAPLATRPVVRVIAWPFVAVLGAVGRLARENALRVPRPASHGDDGDGDGECFDDPAGADRRHLGSGGERQGKREQRGRRGADLGLRAQQRQRRPGACAGGCRRPRPSRRPLGSRDEFCGRADRDLPHHRRRDHCRRCRGQLPGDDEERPAPLAAYIRRSGAVGQPRVVSLHADFHGRIRSGPDAAWMAFTGRQVNTYGPRPQRIFLMDATKAGLPVTVLHVFADNTATMRVTSLPGHRR